jgi:pimeloyl-ACP methyl ester carboxylesterase
MKKGKLRPLAADRMSVASLLTFVFAGTALLAQAQEIGAPLGRLVDIGGRNLHINCSGAGFPTVVLEAGAGAFAIDWALVQPEIARTNRVCSYDRAGSGWSDPSPVVETPATIVSDLHALLQAAGEKPPYILIGASMGGIYARLYQMRYPNEIVGMVLVDPSSEERLFTMFEGKGVTIASLTAEQMRSTIPPGDIPIPKRSPQTGPPFDRLPPNLYQQRIKLETRSAASMPSSISHEKLVASVEGQRAAFAALHELVMSKDHPLGNLPLIVLTRGSDSNQDLKDAHVALARLSTNSRHTVVAGAGHEIHLFDPAAVIQAILDVRDSAKNGTKV